MPASRPTPFRFPAIRPVIPPISAWAHYLEPSYEAKWFSNFGPVVRQFEEALTARLCHSNEIITTANNCTSGIAAPLIALKIRGTVLIPAYTFPGTASAVIMAGATPWIIDVDAQTWCLSPSLLEQTLRTMKCDAVVLVLPFGMQQDLSEHYEICQRHKIPVLVDNASGLKAKEARLPNEFCFEIYSLHATKPFPIGEGGAIRSFESQAESMRHALNFGLQSGTPVPGHWGFNGKLPEVSAAIGLAVLDDFDHVIAHRQAVVGRYLEFLTEFDGLKYPAEAERAPWQTFPLLLPSAKSATQFIENAAKESLHIRRAYFPSLEDWPGTRKLAGCPIARSMAERMVSLPVYSDCTDDEIASIIGIVRRALDAALNLKSHANV
jgi:dTDP-4-amino-4,6-dideoxygalactose transaminase